jgi:hypothetical protein
MNKLKSYEVFLKVFVKGESEEDALDSVYTAVDMCDLLDQDGIVGVEVIEEVELSIDDAEYEE